MTRHKVDNKYTRGECFDQGVQFSKHSFVIHQINFFLLFMNVTFKKWIFIRLISSDAVEEYDLNLLNYLAELKWSPLNVGPSIIAAWCFDTVTYNDPVIQTHLVPNHHRHILNRYTHQHTHSHTLSYTHTHRHSLSLSLSHTHLHSLSHTQSHTLSLTHNHTLYLSHTYTHTHQDWL